MTGTSEFPSPLDSTYGRPVQQHRPQGIGASFVCRQTDHSAQILNLGPLHRSLPLHPAITSRISAPLSKSIHGHSLARTPARFGRAAARPVPYSLRHDLGKIWEPVTRKQGHNPHPGEQACAWSNSSSLRRQDTDPTSPREWPFSAAEHLTHIQSSPRVPPVAVPANGLCLFSTDRQSVHDDPRRPTRPLTPSHAHHLHCRALSLRLALCIDCLETGRHQRNTPTRSPAYMHRSPPIPHLSCRSAFHTDLPNQVSSTTSANVHQLLHGRGWRGSNAEGQCSDFSY